MLLTFMLSFGLSRLPQLQELITEQTDIKPAEQLLLCGGQELTSLVQASQPISKYHLDISSTSPIIVYSTSGTLPQSPVTPTIGELCLIFCILFYVLALFNLKFFI